MPSLRDAMRRPPPTPAMVGHNTVTLIVNDDGLGSFSTFLQLIDASVAALGSNTITAQVGSGPFDTRCNLNIFSVGSLTGTFDTALSDLHITAIGTVGGTFKINSGYGSTIDGPGRLTNATVNDGVRFSGVTPDGSATEGNATIDTTIGATSATSVRCSIAGVTRKSPGS